MNHEGLKPLALGYSLAIVSAICMLVISILGWLGLYAKGVAAMQNWHVYYNLTIVGVLAGIVEAAIVSFVAGILIAWLYNKFV